MITIKTPEEIKIISESGKILASALKKIKKMVKPGITTLELDKAAEAFILSKNALPAFKGYDGFPYSLCASVNENIVHGLPSSYILKEGDLLKLDLGVLYKGFNTDSAVTVAVGKISSEAKRLIAVTEKSLAAGIKKVKPGNTMGDIGHAVQSFAESQEFGVVRDLCGHGIGKSLHEDPKIPNFGKPAIGEKLTEGMVICIEPMITAGDYRLRKSDDGYGYATRDNSLSAHFEHTIVVTKNGFKVLTK
jgi:methionyl aminopeptidase